MTVTVSVAVSVTVSVTVSVSEGRVRGSDRGSEAEARPRHGHLRVDFWQALSPLQASARAVTTTKTPRHQDTKKNTKESLREHPGALVSWWFNFRRVGLDDLQALPPAMTLRAAAGGCRCPLPLPLSPVTAAATAPATAPAVVDPVDLHRHMLNGWLGGNPKSEIRNSKFEIRNPKWAGGRHS